YDVSLSPSDGFFTVGHMAPDHGGCIYRYCYDTVAHDWSESNRQVSTYTHVISGGDYIASLDHDGTFCLTYLDADGTWCGNKPTQLDLGDVSDPDTLAMVPGQHMVAVTHLTGSTPN